MRNAGLIIPTEADSIYAESIHIPFLLRLSSALIVSEQSSGKAECAERDNPGGRIRNPDV